MSHFKREALVNLLFPILVFLVPLLIYFGYMQFFDPKKDIRLTEAKLSAINGSLVDFKKDVGRFPTTEEGLHILVNNIDGRVTNWKGPYISENMLVDAWNSPFVYRSIDKVIYFGSPGKNKILDTTLNDIKMKHQKGDDILLFLESQ